MNTTLCDYVKQNTFVIKLNKKNSEETQSSSENKWQLSLHFFSSQKRLKYFCLSYDVVFDGLSEPPVFIAGQDCQIGHFGIVAEMRCPFANCPFANLPTILSRSVSPNFGFDFLLLLFALQTKTLNYFWHF